MKYALVALLVAFNPLCSLAQKHYLYADGAISMAYLDPGFSATYNYNFIKYIGVGAGVQGYVFHPAKTNPRYFTPGLFADLRFRIRPERISQYFIITDFGINFYKHNTDSVREGNFIYSVPKSNGIYFGLGLGYFLRLTHRGWGAYTSAKLINNIYNEDQFSIVTHETKSVNSVGGTVVFSLGFRFGDDGR